MLAILNVPVSTESIKRKSTAYTPAMSFFRSVCYGWLTASLTHEWWLSPRRERLVGLIFCKRGCCHWLVCLPWSWSCLVRAEGVESTCRHANQHQGGLQLDCRDGESSVSFLSSSVHLLTFSYGKLLSSSTLQAKSPG